MTVPALVAALDLAPHPEGGWYRRTWTSGVTVETPHGLRPSATAILYLLDGVSHRHPGDLSGPGPAGAPPATC